MNTIQRIAKNTGVLLISQIASYIIGFFFIMYTARYLGAEGFGILSFAVTTHPCVNPIEPTEGINGDPLSAS
ncbi:hypothetical protein ES705_22719 [subsurface metagenome]|nr:oligosaccharide flippase family protein [Methanosarcinales archaeon]